MPALTSTLALAVFQTAWVASILWRFSRPKAEAHHGPRPFRHIPSALLLRVRPVAYAPNATAIVPDADAADKAGRLARFDSEAETGALCPRRQVPPVRFLQFLNTGWRLPRHTIIEAGEPRSREHIRHVRLRHMPQAASGRQDREVRRDMRDNGFHMQARIYSAIVRPSNQIVG